MAKFFQKVRSERILFLVNPCLCAHLLKLLEKGMKISGKL